MKIYITITGANEITVRLNNGSPVTKTAKPKLTAVNFNQLLFECDDISQTVENYGDIFINGAPLKGSFITEEMYLSVAVFDSLMGKVFTSSGGGGGSSYLVYTALLSQSGTDAPVATVRSNTLGESTTIAYEAVGIYSITKTGGFVTANTWFTMNGILSSYGATAYISDGEDGKIYIQVRNSEGENTNDLLYLTSIEIRVYP